MILKTGNRILSSSGKLFEIGSTLDFDILGSEFPMSIGNGVFELRFSAPTNVTIDYGNGESVVYPTKTSGNRFSIGDYTTGSPPEYVYLPYIYPDGLSLQRKIRVTFNEAILTAVVISRVDSFVAQPLRLKFNNYPNLASISLSNTKFLDISDNFLNSHYLVSISFINAFNAGSRYSGSIPLQLLEEPIWTNFGYGDSTFGSKSFSESNLDKIIFLKDTLTSLTIQSSGLASLPANFNELIHLSSLDISGNPFVVIPSVVGQITSLTSLNISSNASLSTLGNFSGLVSLVGLEMRRADQLEVALPSWFSSLTGLKTINYNGLGVGSPGKLDAWINELYGFIAVNAPITGTSSDPFRSMVITILPNVTGDGTEIPSGVYQQPSGYNAGVTNGTPASSLERIWVMVHQYAHIWSYRTI